MISSKCFVIQNPTAKPKIEVGTMAYRSQTLEGKVLGLLANRKLNAAKLLEAIGDVLLQKGQIKGVVAKSKNSSSRPFSPDLRDELINQCDVVITGVGDCGSCSSCSVHDAIELERRGIPTVVLVTEPFISSAKAMSKICGIPEYPFVVVSHPIGSLTQKDLREKAENALPDILEILLAQANLSTV